ncbi:MAG: hypothetical protein U9R58_01100 [Chloroflexota bacterium]|nr:hypothetical protein [Chloroflexota bacterium]
MSRYKTSHITSNTNIHTGAGSVISLIISHSEAAAQTITLYDNTIASGTVLAAFKVAPEASPKQITFPVPYYLRFSTGLTVEPGNCTVILQSIGN